MWLCYFEDEKPARPVSAYTRVVASVDMKKFRLSFSNLTSSSHFPDLRYLSGASD